MTLKVGRVDLQSLVVVEEEAEKLEGSRGCWGLG
jgi:hypothetical protein